ncbi:MAG TPA: GreA/GreB family elongation factor, partial [Gemmatimonadales bacterium]|nr:GreA/GreB family elongation factor [Gemmatimonadales bacterium]
ATKERETYELVIPDAMDMDRGHVSVSSPLGRGLLDGTPGKTVTVRLPGGVRKLKIVELFTLHDQVEDRA